MNIRITEDAVGFWDLWVTENGDPNESPVYAAWGRSREQIQSLLSTILTEPTTPAPPNPRPGMHVGARQALLAMHEVLNGWIDVARSNHEASDHRGERVGEECWRSFAPSDIRNMINDAAREVGIAEFAAPPILPEGSTEGAA